MSRFIQPPQQKYQRPQASRGAQGQNPNGCSQMLFLITILLLFNILFFKACAPEETSTDSNANLRAVLSELDSSKGVGTLSASDPSAAKTVPEGQGTVNAQETGTVLDTAPTELSNPLENADAETEKPASDDFSAADADRNAAQNVSAEYLTIGSADPASEYRMLVTFSTRGAAVARVEMNEARLVSMNDGPNFKGGYLGAVSYDLAPESVGGCLVDVVGEGTPAKAAGLRKGDLIVKLNGADVQNALELTEKIRELKPGTKAALTLMRAGQEVQAEAVLTREPVSVIRPERESDETKSLEEAFAGKNAVRENNLSFLTTFFAFGNDSLAGLDMEIRKQIAKDDFQTLNAFLNAELADFDMHSAAWTVESTAADSVTFLYAKNGMEVRKTYTLVKVAEDQRRDETSPTYHLTMKVAVKNAGTQNQLVALQQDGPTGLLTEGYWFCSKAGRDWGTPGIRDVLIGHQGNSTPNVSTCSNIADGKWGKHTQCSQNPIKYIGVDAQYFSSIMIPQHEKSTLAVDRFTMLRVGNVAKDWVTKTNTSCRLISGAKQLAPGEEAVQEFTVFVGPKRPELLSRYELDNVVYYGWFSWIASILVGILHFFYGIFGNYGIAILLLTVVVRLLMFPLSKKQILSSIIMQKMQPEIKRITEKYQDPMERQRAQMELFRKYKYNPMSGCWVMLIQLPIFIALYRAILVDVELRQAPLFTESIRFCSNLVAPDMFFYWSDYVWTTISCGYGMFGLGPYFNLLPVLTIAIFIIQQKIMMPPALDDQARMQQNMMKFMMVFMGFLFFKVPSGLCLYFIMSSLWGLLERKFMPKADNFELSEEGVIDMRVQNGKAYSNVETLKKEGFFARLSKKMEEFQKAVEERDAQRERQMREERKLKKRGR